MSFMFRQLLGFTFAMIVLTGLAKMFAQTQSPASANSLIREEQRTLVNGIPEMWRLQWKSPPEEAACGPEDPLSATTCPCGGFAYAENGQLDLVRMRNRKEIDRLELTPLFEQALSDQKGAIVQNWPFELKDIEESDREGFSERVRTRPIVRLMYFADYNHDGKSTEFFLQTGVAPCAKILGIVVGLTPNNPKLHVFGSMSNPNKPLVLQKAEWEALRKSTGPVEVLDWPCGDHGSEIEVDMALRTINGAIRAVRREFDCTDDGKRARLLTKENR
jgi:hypothetical protein